MNYESLDRYDVLPEDMINYLSNYGRHFNKKLLTFAVSQMKCIPSSTGEVTSLEPYSKAQIDELLKLYDIELEYNQMYDYIYVANMAKADFLNSSIVDEYHLCLYIKDVIDDIDGYDGIVFNRWYADTRRKGISIEWSDMI